jgi:sugar lactone lactonase YvrE
MIHDATQCKLGEGAFWHPQRHQFFWCDILSARLHTKDRHWQFHEMISALAWVDHDTLLIASETRLFLFDLRDGGQRTLCALDADNPATRSNDGRADPQGGFWIGTMGKRAEAGAGGIWRYHNGELRCLFPGITIPNAICFATDGKTAFFTDTVTRVVQRVALGPDGWPVGDPTPYLDLRADRLNPDGAVIDRSGNMWLAQWGASRVAVYDPQGRFMAAHGVGARHSSCPSFGGATLSDLYVTSALQDISAPAPEDGATFCLPGLGQGQAEHRVLI